VKPYDIFLLFALNAPHDSYYCLILCRRKSQLLFFLFFLSYSASLYLISNLKKKCAYDYGLYTKSMFFYQSIYDSSLIFMVRKLIRLGPTYVEFLISGFSNVKSLKELVHSYKEIELD
jgi:hypothetical protein